MASLLHTCPMCGENNYLRLEEEEVRKYHLYEAGMGLVQTLFPNLNPAEREFIKSGYCLKCQALLFGTNFKSDRIGKEDI